MNTELLVLLAAGAAGAALARLLRLPMWPMTGSLLGSAAAHVIMATGTALPFGFGFTAQVLVGTAVGASVLPGFARAIGQLIAPAVTVVAVLVTAGIGAGVVMSHLGILGQTEALLGMVPGGVGEMVAAASALSADSALVAGIHVIRLLLMIWMLPLMIRWAARWEPPRERF